MIGIFDSGIGGLSVVKAIERHLPDCNLIYFGDTARFPYGIKGPEVIKKYARENAEFLINQGAKVIVVACNTASAVALDYLKKQFPNTPIFGVIESAVAMVVKTTKNGRIGIIGTRATIGSGVYEKKIQKIDSFLVPSPHLWGEGGVRGQKVFSQACPLLVSLIEEDWIKKPETKTILAKYLKPLKAKKIDTLVLGCTHYPFIKNLIQKEMGNDVKLIDCGEALASELKNLTPALSFSRRGLKGEIKNQFYVSDLTPNFEKLAEKWLNKKINLKLK